jgi:hypothetical protein
MFTGLGFRSGRGGGLPGASAGEDAAEENDSDTDQSFHHCQKGTTRQKMCRFRQPAQADTCAFARVRRDGWHERRVIHVFNPRSPGRQRPAFLLAGGPFVQNEAEDSIRIRLIRRHILNCDIDRFVVDDVLIKKPDLRLLPEQDDNRAA